MILATWNVRAGKPLAHAPKPRTWRDADVIPLQECCEPAPFDQHVEPLSGYGVRIELGDALRARCVDDKQGDSLDAVLAAVQAAWAWEHRDDGFGVPAGSDLGEGGVADPATRRASTTC